MVEDTLQRSRVDVAWLCALRVLLGLVMCAGALRFMAKGWIHEFFVKPEFHFAYPGLGFVRPLPEPLLWSVFVAMALLALGLALGLWYRACALGLLVAFT